MSASNAPARLSMRVPRTGTVALFSRRDTRRSTLRLHSTWANEFAGAHPAYHCLHVTGESASLENVAVLWSSRTCGAWLPRVLHRVRRLHRHRARHSKRSVQPWLEASGTHGYSFFESLIHCSWDEGAYARSAKPPRSVS